MIKFTCNNCNESFRIEEVNLKPNDKIFCQNCKQELSDEIIGLLKTYALKQKEAMSNFNESNKVIKENNIKWSITLES